MKRKLIIAVVAAMIFTTVQPAVADVRPLSGSGFFDIVARQSNNTLDAWRNVNGLRQPTFPAGPRQIGQGWDNPYRIKFGDLDGDTYDELISVDYNTDLVRVFRNVNGTFPGGGVVVGRGWNNYPATYFADIDGDGRDEIISLRNDTAHWGQIWAWHNNKGIATDTYNTGYSVIGTGWDASMAHNVYFADLTGDRKDEIISLTLDGEIWAWLNVNGAYTAGYTVIGRGWTSEFGWQVKFADIDNDQRAEVISTLGGDVRAWRNNKGLTPDTYAGSPVTIARGFNGADTSFAEIFP